MAISQILGPDGQPIQIPDLDEPQTSRLAHLQQEMQSHPTRGLTPSKLARILDQAETGDLTAQFELFEDMEEKDGHIASEMSKRRRACLVEWELVPPVNATPLEVRNTEHLAELVAETPDFEDALFDITDGIGKGFECSELEYHRVGKSWLLKTVTHRPQSWFQLHRGYRQELRLRTNTVDADGVMGAALQPFGWITHTHKAKSGYLERSALFRQLVWTYLFKNYSVGDLAEFLEIYGIPLRIGKYPPNASEKEKATLLRALVGVGHNAAGIIPESMLIDFKDAATGDPAAFELMMNWCERNQSKVILGGTLTSGADGKSSTNALGNIHNEVRKDLRDGDLRQLNTTITRDLVYSLAALNGLAPDGPRRCPQFRLNAQEAEDLTAYADALPKLVSIGFRPTVAWGHEKLGIPMAQDGEPVLGVPAPAAPPPPAQPGQPGTAALTASLPVQRSVPTPPPVALAGQLANNAAPAVSVWVEVLRDLVMRSNSLEEIRDGLEQLLPNMTLDQYAQAMGEAMQAAHLAGRWEVLNEASQP